MRWSIATAAHELGCSANTIKNYERGYRLDKSREPTVIPRYIYLATEALKLGVR